MKNGHFSHGRIGNQQGVVLLESLIALLIFSMGVIALVGLQAAMAKNTSEARYRAEAAFIAQQKLGEIWVNAKNGNALADYAVSDEDISIVLPEGKRTVEVASAPECTLTISVSWQAPGSDPHIYTTSARLNSLIEDGTCIYKVS